MGCTLVPLVIYAVIQSTSQQHNALIREILVMSFTYFVLGF